MTHICATMQNTNKQPSKQEYSHGLLRYDGPRDVERLGFDPVHQLAVQVPVMVEVLQTNVKVVCDSGY